MRLRELLQIEIWSKRTSRRILVWLSIGFGVVAIVGISGYLIEEWFLSPNERNAAKAALVEIDAIQNRVAMNDRDFDEKYRQAKAKVENAKQAEWTIRDENVALVLDHYLGMTEINRSSVRMKMFMQKRKVAMDKANIDFGSALEHEGAELAAVESLELHALLD